VSLKEFLDRVVTESTEHLVLIYNDGYSREETLALIEAFADHGIPTIRIAEGDLLPRDASGIDIAHSFYLPLSEMLASSDDVLHISIPRSCQRVLLLRSADLNTFRLINHAHAMNWATVYFPNQSVDEAGSDLEAKTYAIKNAEHVIAGSESLKIEMQAIGARGVKIFPAGRSAKDQVTKILELVGDPRAKSPVRLAIEGANYV
jgi:hypothetical protein